MKKSELKRIIQEELKGYSKYTPGGETKGGTTDDFRNILTTIAKSVPKEDSEEKTVSENSINFNEEEIKAQFPDLDLSYGFKGENMHEIRSIRKRNLTKEEFESIISFLEDRGYTVLRNKSTMDLDDDGDRWYYPSIIFTAPTEA
jgi:hypothetical protein